MLKLIDITKEYIVEKESTLALKGVSIEFRKNEFVSILGPSGCGKTTLLNIIGGLDRYNSGDIQIDGISTKEYDDVDWDTYRNRRIGFVFQSYNLIPHMNILKNVAMSLTIAGVEREERKARALEALEKVGLAAQARKRPNQLSGGQMQRVAIARALVNNPDIILADEPTGALDSESGIQVMDLLKEVAEDRLVIMVTHNPMLAEEYSTRIVYLKDGEIEGDTMPYDSAMEDGALEDIEAQYGADGVSQPEDDADKNGVGCDASEESFNTSDVADGCSFEGSDGNEIKVAVADSADSGVKPKKKKMSLGERLKKIRQADKAAMKLGTAISLSWNNLLSKKGRTFLTSIAGSIGIIGIILVLALSNGAGLYVRNLEESALSSYPLKVSKSSMDISSMLGMFMSPPSSSGKFEEGTITTQEVLGQVIANIKDILKENDLYSFKKYIDENFDNSLASVKYNYGTTFNAYILDPANVERPESEAVYMKVNPYSEMMTTVLDGVLERMPALKDVEITIGTETYTITSALNMMSGMLSDPWCEISDNKELLNNQYDLVGNSRWPQKSNEIVIVVNENNKLMDYQLFMLGLKSTDDLINAMDTNTAFAEATFPVEQLLGLEYRIMTNADYLIETSEGSGKWEMHDRKDLAKDFVDENSMKFDGGRSDTVKVVGVVRPKKGVVATSINGVIGYSSALTEAMLEHSTNHPAVSAMIRAYESAKSDGASTLYKSVISFSEIGYVDNSTLDLKIGDSVYFGNAGADDKRISHDDLMRKLGFVDTDYPLSIDFYCTSFESKDAIEEFIREYERVSKKQIKYSDSLSSMMAFVNTMTDTITGVLVAFAAISLVVSTIMIAIIIYTSVLERRKEIGVLRSIGARKKDISRVFIAESAILGGYSGLIGIIVSAIISAIGSVVLKTVFGIQDLMNVTWWHCLMMFMISMLLSMLAGFIPSRIAAKKDPAIALRSE